VELHLALIGPDPGPVAASSCHVRDLRLEWMPDPWQDVAATEAWIEELSEICRPDVVHMNTFAPVGGGELGARGGEPPVLLTVHSCVLTWWRAVHGAAAPPAWDRYRELVQRALRRASLVTTPSHSLFRALWAEYPGMPPARVIPNGRALPGRRRRAERERLVVTVGRLWDEAKNARLVARAVPAIDGRVVVIGPGEVPGVETLGEVDEREVVSWLSRAAVFAEPARYEPFGLAALEAALCGCALVLGDIPSLREIWDAAASFVAPDDPEALAFELNHLLVDPVRRGAAARRVWERALGYTPAAMADAYLEAYRAVQPSLAAEVAA
jgi:glycosyltransferase involved in cell wall biosynthesis